MKMGFYPGCSLEGSSREYAESLRAIAPHLGLELEEVEGWGKRSDIKLVTTVDPGGETPDWKGKVGFVPSILDWMEPSSENTIAIVCGPPIMIKFTFPELLKLGFTPETIYTTLENRMKCGVGKCGRCTVGPVYVCKDGPVFT
jgi:sulfhydrogenase subunit gamma (sulfur reductase)